MYHENVGSQYYGGLIWTNHALDRMRQRGLKQEDALQAFSHPDRTVEEQSGDSIRYQKKNGTSQITVVAKKNDRSEWIVISAWVDPPLPGSEDEKRQKAYRDYQRASFWKKTWLTILNQLGFRKF